MNCHECKHRRSVPGSAHSACNLLNINDTGEALGLLIAMRPSQFPLRDFMETKVAGEIVDSIELHPTGVKGGWATWPIDFDPVWVTKCIFYAEKD